MYLITMRPQQIQDAVRRNLPALFCAGSVEYHGPHLPVGTDFLIAESLLTEIEKKCECVVAPSIPFSSTMGWAGGPEEGDVDFDPDAFYVYAKAELKGLMNMGFRRIYVLQFHQGANGLPCLTLKRAAAACIREAAKNWGNGWGRKDPSRLPNPDVFSWIRVVSNLDEFSRYPDGDAERISLGHGGKGETQLVMARHEDTVRMEALHELEKLPQWLEDAWEADRKEGEKWLAFCVEGWVRELSGDIFNK
mgnify:CR=1 FL=1